MTRVLFMINHEEVVRLVKGYHESFVHVVLSAGAAVVVLGVDGETEEENIHHHLEHRQEAVCHQVGEHTHDDQGQNPHRVLTLVIQRQHARERGAGHDQDLKNHAEALRLTSSRNVHMIIRHVL